MPNRHRLAYAGVACTALVGVSILLWTVWRDPGPPNDQDVRGLSGQASPDSTIAFERLLHTLAEADAGPSRSEFMAFGVAHHTLPIEPKTPDDPATACAVVGHCVDVYKAVSELLLCDSLPDTSETSPEESQRNLFALASCHRVMVYRVHCASAHGDIDLAVDSCLDLIDFGCLWFRDGEEYGAVLVRYGVRLLLTVMRNRNKIATLLARAKERVGQHDYSQIFAAALSTKYSHNAKNLEASKIYSEQLAYRQNRTHRQVVALHRLALAAARGDSDSEAELAAQIEKAREEGSSSAELLEWFSGNRSGWQVRREWLQSISDLQRDASAMFLALRAAETHLAWQLYRCKYDAAPPGLSSLVPEFLDKVPLDPFSGSPLRLGRDPTAVSSAEPIPLRREATEESPVAYIEYEIFD